MEVYFVLPDVIHITACNAAPVPIQTGHRHRTPVYIEPKPLPCKWTEVQSLYNWRTGIHLVSRRTIIHFFPVFTNLNIQNPQSLNDCVLGVKCGNHVTFLASCTENFLVTNRLIDLEIVCVERLSAKINKLKTLLIYGQQARFGLFAHALIHKV